MFVSMKLLQKQDHLRREKLIKLPL